MSQGGDDEVSTPALTRQNTLEATPPPATPTPEVTEEETQSNGASQRVKITADNGWKVLHKLSTSGSERKRLKRDKSSASLKSEGSFSASQMPKRSARRGKLAALLSLPLDVLFEIFGHLAPLDVLHLARTTNDFRRLLLNKNATSLWKTVWTYPGLDEDIPQCPEDVSLPCWTNLVFSPHCHNCTAPNVRTIDWVLRMRLCNKCAKELLIARGKFNPNKNKLDKIILACVLFQERLKDGESRFFCLKKEKDAFVKELEAQTGDRNEFIARKTEEKKIRTEHAEKCQEWSDRLEEERQDQITLIKIERQEEIVKRLEELGYKEEFAFLKKIHGSNKQGIVPPQPDELPYFWTLDEVKVAKPLTERSWNARVKSVLVDYMEEVRCHRIINEDRLLVERRRKVFASVYPSWLSSKPQLERYPPGYFMPTIVDVMEHPHIKALTHRDTDKELTPDQVLAHLEAFHPFIDEWRCDKATKLYHEIPPNTLQAAGLHSYIPPNTLDWLEYAVFAFKCTKPRSVAHILAHAVDAFSRPYDHTAATPTFSQIIHDLNYEFDSAERPMWFPEYLHHACNKIGRAHKETELCRHNRFFQVDRFVVELHEDAKLHRTEWNFHTLEFHPKVSVIVQHLLEGCNLPITTKVKELDEIDPRVICLKCTYGGKIDGHRRAPVRSWRTAVDHALTTHWGSNTVRFQRISDEDAAIARKLEGEEWTRRFGKNQGIPPPQAGNYMHHRLLRCLLCREAPQEEGPLTRDALCDHLELAHDMNGLATVLDPDAKGTIFTTETFWDQAPPQPLTIQLVPKAAHTPSTDA